MNRLLKAKYLIPFIIVVIFVIAGTQHRLAINDLRKNGVIVNATIVDYLGSTKGGSGANPSFRCKFLYDGKMISLISNSTLNRGGFSYIGKTYPALYSQRMNTVRLLMNKEDFDKFGLDYLDTFRQQ